MLKYEGVDLLTTKDIVSVGVLLTTFALCAWPLWKVTIPLLIILWAVFGLAVGVPKLVQKLYMN